MVGFFLGRFPFAGGSEVIMILAVLEVLLPVSINPSRVSIINLLSLRFFLGICAKFHVSYEVNEIYKAYGDIN